MLNLNLQGDLIKIVIVLQLVEKFIVAPEGVIEDVMVSIESWDYPTKLLLLQPKTNFNGYPLILRRPWLAIVEAYINSRVGNMTIKNGNIKKKLVLYPLFNPLLSMNYLCG